MKSTRERLISRYNIIFSIIFVLLLIYLFFINHNNSQKPYVLFGIFPLFIILILSANSHIRSKGSKIIDRALDSNTPILFTIYKPFLLVIVEVVWEIKTSFMKQYCVNCDLQIVHDNTIIFHDVFTCSNSNRYRKRYMYIRDSYQKELRNVNMGIYKIILDAPNEPELKLKAVKIYGWN